MLILHTVDLDQVVIGRQLGVAGPMVALTHRVLATAYGFFIAGYSKTLRLLLSTADIYRNTCVDDKNNANYLFFLTLQLKLICNLSS